jgi:hypothetical protein
MERIRLPATSTYAQYDEAESERDEPRVVHT